MGTAYGPANGGRSESSGAPRVAVETRRPPGLERRHPLVEECGDGPDSPRISTSDPQAEATVAFCGWSGSGKTTLLESLVPRLTRRGLAVAVVKVLVAVVYLEFSSPQS